MLQGREILDQERSLLTFESQDSLYGNLGDTDQDTTCILTDFNADLRTKPISKGKGSKP